MNGFWQLILDNPNKDWSWRAISQNPSITLEIIENNPLYWNYTNVMDQPYYTLQ